jgi:hypothetical protein
MIRIHETGIRRNILTGFRLVAIPVLHAFRSVDPRRYNGATHRPERDRDQKPRWADIWPSTPFSALAEVSHNVPERIGRELTAMAAKGVVA